MSLHCFLFPDSTGKFKDGLLEAITDLFAGYEKYVLMRMDPSLCFLSRCGPPDQKAIIAAQQDNDDDLK